MNEPLEGPSDWTPLLEHLERAYPNEGCGVLVRGPSGVRVLPLTNAYDRYHAHDPGRFPRTSRTAYLFDPKEFLRISEAMDADGETLTCIFHSHTDVGSYFSGEDALSAAPDGEPLFPGVSYLVVAVDQGKARSGRVFHWEDGTFQERPLAGRLIPGL